MNYYKYIIGRLYSWARRRENDTPIANVVLTMCLVHYFQLFTLYMILRAILKFPDYLSGINKLFIAAFLIAFFVAYYFIFYKKEKWDYYAEYVEKQELKTRKRGKLLVLLYLVGSILLFFIALPIAFSIIR